MSSSKTPTKPSGAPDILQDADFFAKKKYTSPKDLLNRLQELRYKFRDLPQPPEGEPMPFNPRLAQTLVHEHYLKHPNKDVQLLVCCIIADILRLNAPENPFPRHHLKDIFQAWLRQFELLTEQKEKEKSQVIYLLERTAAVKSFILLTDPELECDHETEKLFKLFLNRINPSDLENSLAIFKHMEDVLESILDESATITQELLDVLLNNLCGSARKNKTHGYRLAKAVLEHTQDKLQATVSHVMETALNEHFAAARKYDDLPEFSKQRQDHLRIISRHLEMVEELELIHEVFLGAKLKPFLEDESEDLRLMTVETVCNIFLNRPRYCKTYQQVLVYFLARFNDRSKKIRSKMVTWCQDMMVADDWFRNSHSGYLLAALDDKEDAIRRQAVTAVVEVARKHPQTIPRSLIKGLDHRCRNDRKVLVRKHCLQKLCLLYADLAPSWIGKDDSNPAREICRWIPAAVLSYSEDKDPDMREAVLQVVHALLPSLGKGKGKEEDGRKGPDTATYATAFLELYRCLGITRPVKTNWLQQVLLIKAALRKFVADFVPLRAAGKAGGIDNKKDYDYCLAQLTDRTNTVRADWLELAKLRDEKIFKCLANLVDTVHPCDMAEAVTLKEQMVSKVKAAVKSEQLVLFVQNLVAKLLFPVAPEHVTHLVSTLRDHSKGVSHDVATFGALATLAYVQPSLFITCAGDFLTLVLAETDESALAFGLRALALLKQQLPQDEALQKKALVQLRLQCLEGSLPLRKLALRCIQSTQPDPQPAVKAIGADVQKHLVVGQRGSPGFLGALKTLQLVFEVCSDQHGVPSRTLKFIENEVLGFYTETKEAGTSWESPPYECQAWDLGLKALVAFLRGESGVQAVPHYVKFFFTLLKHQSQSTVASISQSFKITALYKAVLKMLQFPACRKEIQATHLSLLMVANLFEGNDRARESMCAKVFHRLFAGQLPMKYCWMLIVNVLDIDKRNSALARDYVVRAIQKYRDQEHALDKSGQRVSLSDREAPLVCPEYILPDLLYHLAHYPNFEEHHPHYEPMQICFYVYFEAVTKDTDNISFFYKLLQQLKRCNDGLQPASKNTKILCDIAFEIVHNEYGKTRNSSGKPFPGAVHMPRLFKVVESPEDDAVSYKPTMFRLIGKPRALKAGAPVEAASPIKEAAAPKRKEQESGPEDVSRAHSPARTPVPKRRKLLFEEAQGGDDTMSHDDDTGRSPPKGKPSEGGAKEAPPPKKAASHTTSTRHPRKSLQHSA